MIAALFVETGGAYFGLPGVAPWDEARDARRYAGHHPVVAHPPCQRWGRFWHGSTRKPHQFEKGADDGCFASALASLRRVGGVLEHPADSLAWDHFGLCKPPRAGGWIAAGPGLWTCCVYQGHYGHISGKPTWLLAAGVEREALPELRWGKVEQRLHPVALAKHGYAKARRIGIMSMIGGKDKTKIRNATPAAFRDLLLTIAASVPRSSGAIAYAGKPMHCATEMAVNNSWRVPRDGSRAVIFRCECGSTLRMYFDGAGKLHGNQRARNLGRAVKDSLTTAGGPNVAR